MGRSNGSRISLQPKHKGVAVLAKFSEDFSTGFGFVELAGSDGSRESNVWFGVKATQGLPIGRGDEVDVVFDRKIYDRGRVAYRVFVSKRAVENDREEITTLAGIDDL